MIKTAKIIATASLPFAALLASCGAQAGGDSTAAAQSTPSPQAARGGTPFNLTTYGTFNEPWAAEFAPGTDTLFITEKPGTMKFVDTASGRTGSVTGLPRVDYGGQGGLGDVAFLPSESANEVGRRTIYLSWAEAGEGDTRGAVVGKGTLDCTAGASCNVEGLNVIWRQTPKVTGRGHYSHRIAFSPDEDYLFVSSGDRQKLDPAQDLGNTLGTIVRLTLDGEPAPGNPFADRGSPTDEIWSYGHRNTLGLQFDSAGRLWNMEHGPAGGDEINLIEPGTNYGWPIVSDGEHYDGRDIPDHSTRPEFQPPAIGWTPVIAPGDFIFYDGDAFEDWKGNVLLAGLKTEALIRVAMNGTNPVEVARYPMGNRLREVVEGPDGAIWVLEDREGARLIKLTPS